MQEDTGNLASQFNQATQYTSQQTLVKSHFVNYSDRSVLLVEDNLINQKLALKLLEKFNIIRKRDIMTPIAALTANASEEDRKQYLACGMNDFFIKALQYPEYV